MKTLTIYNSILYDNPKKSLQIAKIRKDSKKIKSHLYAEAEMVRKDDEKPLKKERRSWKEMDVGLSQEFMNNFREIFLKKDCFIQYKSTQDNFRRNTG